MLRRCSKQLIWNILNENVHWNRSKDFCSAVNINLLLEFKASDEKEVVKLLTLTGIYRAILFCLLKLEACSLLSHKIRIIYERNRSLFMRVARARVCVYRKHTGRCKDMHHHFSCREILLFERLSKQFHSSRKTEWFYFHMFREPNRRLHLCSSALNEHKRHLNLRVNSKRRMQATFFASLDACNVQTLSLAILHVWTENVEHMGKM